MPIKKWVVGLVLAGCMVGCTAPSHPVYVPPLVPAAANLASVDSLPMNPSMGDLPVDAAQAEQIRYGLRLMQETPTLAAEFVGNTLTCTNCHLNAGQRMKALPLAGVAGLFPLYRARDGRMVSLEDRIRGCFLRSMNGTAPPYDDPGLLALSAYIAWLGEGLPAGRSPGWRGLNSIPAESRIPIAQIDAVRGRALFTEHCVACHGADGQGVDLGIAHPGPLWGSNSWNDGAGASRIYKLAGFIRFAMPLTDPGILTDHEAQEISAFINSHERPVFAAKDADYPGVGVPIDAVYDARRFTRNPFFSGK